MTKAHFAVRIVQEAVAAAEQHFGRSDADEMMMPIVLTIVDAATHVCVRDHSQGGREVWVVIEHGPRDSMTAHVATDDENAERAGWLDPPGSGSVYFQA
ncbi:MAG TPA: hypothetical protein VMX12_03560 [Acidimicrobiia bacterium]|nr:hypothetical protein [Acidimicrobiia bacterium]